jgi:hypothetical protein
LGILLSVRQAANKISGSSSKTLLVRCRSVTGFETALEVTTKGGCHGKCR